MSKKITYDYYAKFVELVDYSLRSAVILNSTLHSYNQHTMDKHLKGLHALEHDADLAKHNMMQQLSKEFIAPLEREDIVNLSQEIDNITDSIEDVLLKIHMYNVTKIRPDIFDFTKLIISCCETLKVALVEFHDYKKSSILQKKLIEVNHLEEQGDTLYYSAVHKLFRTCTNAVDLLVWSEIYSHLEKCCDSCENVADVIESVIMKNS